MKLPVRGFDIFGLGGGEGAILPEKERKRVLVLGGGLAGLRVTLSLEKKMRSMTGWEILLLDENEYHQYLYRVHEVVGGRASPSEVIVPFSHLLRGKRIEFVQAKVQDVDPSSRLVHTDLGPVSYDILVVALGSHTEFYGIDGLRENSLTLRSVEDAARLRLEVERLFTSCRVGSEGRIVVGGGGAVGVELVAELFELVQALRKKHGVREEVEVILVEANERLASSFDSQISEKIAQKLRSLGIRVILGDRVVKAGRGYVDLNSGARVRFSLLVWTGGGVRDSSCGALLEVKSRRLCIDAYSRAEGLRGVYVAGDCALVVDPATGEALSPSAHLALEQADLVAKNIFSDIARAPKTEYTATHAGDVVSIGSGDSVGVLFGVPVYGLLGRLIKSLIHLRYVWSIGGLNLILRGKNVGSLAARKLLRALNEEKRKKHLDEALEPKLIAR